ncbi:MAG TPA: tRNA (adenosine(37)-N6)-threonylcarbamoyltransferase complex ATPase subunit type 1 TsaE [Gammaproteobacteria bacterium]|uniref:tRNA threonylcarbamoyladenosine biosynthesis protein TsaE n=1 Tax=OM182 bacterium TaxID=2510334 RepID=A0A520RX47_9GAMM|nr:tRNA (adenosine(37)-N6)-threonylcarbamoyltransferase complex ATPase subunit type 1 TsaE [Gammaproteobacteria bacterium]OUX32474.1 MAG: tRNA (adenosine(37)-N6)-threonylcarbamoyltransferase complex ATPase subunit type 1 TsaE [Gammaproteobacteria bacterium TMED260]RPG44615.1 MAG: tRNA (adenosine(37)-N6)-threonylcarbamoyltransferase complex ATPase subunit type 1 TsaE [Gammaproteobacteria bacterium TMED163]RZO74764.1 MAG: tRNA (adenosine(37)-N6)-threonylcarbamoyltransferase complex ATPase subunit |tara:strand:- start:268 stop:777 length:510 start_codon:yes stop_codon:yes gene_type:complete
MSTSKQFTLKDEEATLDFGAALARATFLNPDDAQTKSGEPGCRSMGAVIYLLGDLGAGKTTLTRGFLRGFGFHGAVKSPTYTLVEPYEFSLCKIYHFDLYRLTDPAEVQYLGIDDYFQQQNICLLEWAERGRDLIPAPDLSISLRGTGTGREISCQTHTAKGERIAARL